ncbi:outer membrane lipid asymmetry maintenance protein MlaD [Candidatus Bandiella euplotis]|uniref:MlaD superfamily outer membrane lipid asymmetry maintenance protein n=1 Tax=Candidatus Bandiella euplotis TaxID=1664265 RepID=A0ABZ0UN46_9RICK|nr:outer membrane lipid asymmetry maintenance protein MlaD [Candidatus Bandiella woodruffii]WPX96947.1 Putative MlaD superfamily outer membrane lipid asymmetry maintenance protein [Candidatus Bandiella woodruffii]
MKNIFETIVGFLVLFIAGMFTYFAYQSSGEKLDVNSQYALTASFDNIDGIKVGSEVKISGITVGKVIYQELDYDTYSAIIKITLDKKIRIPEDSSAQIMSSSLIGDKYVLIVPGTEEKMLQDGETIEFTQSSMNIEGVISKFLFGLKEGGGSNNNENENEDDNVNKSNDKANEQNYIFNDSGTENSIS